MYRILQLIGLLALAGVSTQDAASTPVPLAGTLDHSRDGFWFNPNRPGHGLTLQAIPGVPGSTTIGSAHRVIGVYNTFQYYMFYSSEQRWFHLDSKRCGVQYYHPTLSDCIGIYPASNQAITLEVYEFVNGRLNVSNPTWLIDYRKPGKLTITFHSCTSATARLDWDHGFTSYTPYSESFPLVRLTPHPDCAAAPGVPPPAPVANALGHAFAGNWANPLTASQGFVLEPILGTNQVIGVWQTFTPATYFWSQPLWFYLTGTSTSNRSADLDIYVAHGGGHLGMSSTPGPITIRQVGHASLQFESCLRGTISAQFDVITYGQHYYLYGQNYQIPLINLAPNPTCRAEAGPRPRL